MNRIDPEAWQLRLACMTEIFTGMVLHANELATQRCPYKNRHNQCTAKFGCRNQRRPSVSGDPFFCAGDDKLNYRSAWEDTQTVQNPISPAGHS